jgi:hypothetical protein
MFYETNTSLGNIYEKASQKDKSYILSLIWKNNRNMLWNKARIACVPAEDLYQNFYICLNKYMPTFDSAKGNLNNFLHGVVKKSVEITYKQTHHIKITQIEEIEENEDVSFFSNNLKEHQIYILDCVVNKKLHFTEIAQELSTKYKRKVTKQFCSNLYKEAIEILKKDFRDGENFGKEPQNRK